MHPAVNSNETFSSLEPFYRTLQDRTFVNCTSTLLEAGVWEPFSVKYTFFVQYFCDKYIYLYVVPVFAVSANYKKLFISDLNTDYTMFSLSMLR